MINHPKEYDEDQVFFSAIMDDAFIPSEFPSKIRICHNSTCKHHGVNRNISKLDEAFPKWKFQRQHVTKFIKECPLCQKISQIKVQIHYNPFTTSWYTPMECLNIDYVGPHSS